MIFYTILLLATIAVTSGTKWNDFRGGKISLPIKQHLAETSGWAVSEKDDNLKINWYKKHSDDVLAVAFDQKGNCAGVRVVVKESDIDPEYRSIYRQQHGIFEVVDLKGQKAYKSVILFTPEMFLQKGGRNLKWMSEDEVAYYAYLKEGGKYNMLQKEICIQKYHNYNEQRCIPKYGLVLTPFKSSTECGHLKPFYTIFNLEDDIGELIGFGWVFFRKESKKTSFLEHITSDNAEKIFPHSPSCLKSYSNLHVAEIWLNFADSQQVSCPSSSWAKKNCKRNKDSSSSEEQESVDESFWSKWFG